MYCSTCSATLGRFYLSRLSEGEPLGTAGVYPMLSRVKGPESELETADLIRDRTDAFGSNPVPPAVAFGSNPCSLCDCSYTGWPK